MKFYLGTHHPSWLARDLGVPLLVSHRRLASRRTLPRASGPWALDSGGFTELSLHGRWRTSAAAYVTAVRRYSAEIGNLDWAAPRDRMTEDHVLARTGLSLRTDQHLTVIDYLRLRDLAPELPFIPVLQGQSITDYHWCADMYKDRGVDLSALPLVGVGSVCRRQHTTEVEQILRSLAARGYKLHAVGAEVLSLLRYADAIASSDSASWSLRGRYLPGCTSSHRSESNCLHFALAWHRRLLTTLEPELPKRHLPTTALPKLSPTPTAPAVDDQRTHRRKGQSLAATEDGGHSWWTITDTGLPAYRSGVTWTGHAYLAVGPSGSDLSVDDGRTWTSLGSTGFDSVRTAQDDSCWAAGQDGHMAQLVVDR